ncbi:MAG: helix-turn-helix transcriptional regulator [bacterium]
MEIKPGLSFKLERIRRGLKQFEVAQAMGVPQTALWDMENDRRPFPEDFAAKAWQALEQLKPMEEVSK